MQTDYLQLHVAETSDALITTTADDRVVYWSPGAETTYGYSESEARDRSLADLM
jgi:PAS domain S-box-containing protein